MKNREESLQEARRNLRTYTLPHKVFYVKQKRKKPRLKKERGVTDGCN